MLVPCEQNDTMDAELNAILDDALMDFKCIGRAKGIGRAVHLKRVGDSWIIHSLMVLEPICKPRPCLI